jgi:hypothetical protein
MAIDKTSPPADPTEPAAQQQAPVDFTKTPEFQEAVKAAAKAAAEQARVEMTASMTAILAASRTNGSDINLKDVIGDLAGAIIGANDPKNDRRRISPAEAERRAAAFDKMGELIMVGRKHKRGARYRVVAKTYLGETFIEPWQSAGDGKWVPTEIIWNGAPNGALRPMDDAAEAIYEQYLIYIGGSTKNPAGVQEQPTWVQGGIVMVGTPSETARAHGRVRDPAPPIEVPDFDTKALGPTQELTSTDDPNATAIPILGTQAQPARRTDAGNIKQTHITG